jgi:hypothetical protein
MLFGIITLSKLNPLTLPTKMRLKRRLEYNESKVTYIVVKLKLYVKSWFCIVDLGGGGSLINSSFDESVSANEKKAFIYEGIVVVDAFG